MSPKQSRAYIGVPDAAAYLDVDEKTIRRLISGNKLPAYRLGNRVIKIKLADLEGVLAPVGAAAAIEHAKSLVSEWPEPTADQLERIAGLLKSASPPGEPPGGTPPATSGGTTSPAKSRRAVVESRIAALDGGA